MDSVAGTYVSGGFEPAELESKHGGRTCRIAGIYWTLAAVVMVVSLGQASSYGQVLSVDDNRAAQFIEPSRTLRQILRDAETAAGEKRWGDVVLGLGELLSRPLGLDPDDPLGGEDFFLDAPEPGGVHKESCRRRAERMLAEMPAEGLQIYRLRYQAEAKRLLDQAAEKRDWDQLEEVSRRFPHTQSGYEAAVLMAGRELSRGQPRAAAILLERLHDFAPARQELGDGLTQMLQRAWVLAGQQDRAEALGKLTSANEASGSGTPAAAAQKVPTEWKRRASEAGTIVNGGNAARTGETGGALPIQHPRWKTFLAINPQEVETLDGLRQQRSGQSGSAVPSWQPLVAGKYLLARTTERLKGFDLQHGNLVWHFPYGDIAPGFEAETSSVSEDAGEGGVNLLDQRVWQDLPYGRVTSDGQRVFMLDDLAPFERSPLGGFGAIGGLRAGIRPRDTDTCKLVAVELETEGKVLWEVSGRDTTEPGLRGAFFLGPPLPLAGRLYVIMDVGGDTYLACLKAVDGSFLWRQHLTTSDAGGVSTDAIRRMIGAVPSYSDGVMVCPTGQGALVAIDIATRRLRWARALPRTPRLMNSGVAQMGRFNSYESMNLGDNWLDGTAVISDGAVLAALPECESLVCANLLTGDFLWDRIERGNWNYIAGVYNKRFYLVGDKSVMAFDLRTSGKAWSQPATLPNGQRVAGRTVFGEDSLLLPSTNSQIYSISTEDGRILDSVKVDYPAGNLTVAAGSLFSQGISEVGAAYLGGEALENSIRSRLELNPKDVWALTRRSESLLESGKYRDAIESLRLAREQQPRDEEIRVLLVEALLKLVRAEPDAVPEFTKELEQLADLAEERIELLRVLAEGAIRQQQWQVAIDRLVALSKLASIGANRPSLARGERIELGDRDVSLDDWIGARVAELVRGRSADELVKLQKPVEQFIGSLGTLPNPLRERLLRQFGQLAAGDEMRLALVRQWIEDREFLKAERALLEAVDSVGDSDGRRPWHLMLARLYAEAGWVEDAEYHLSQGEAGGKAASDEELGGWERALLMDRIQADEHGYFWQPWPQYVKVTQASQELSSQSLEPKFLNASGRRARHWRAWTVAETTTSEIRLITPGGQTEVTVNLPEGGRKQMAAIECVFDGGLLLIGYPGELLAIDLFSVEHTNEVLWRRSTGSDASMSSSQNRQEALALRRSDRESIDNANHPQLRLASPINRRGFMYSGGRLVCFDVLDGTELWSKSAEQGELKELDPRAIYPTVFDNRFALVVTKSKDWFEIDPYDGEVLQRHPWSEERSVLEVHGPYVMWSKPLAENKGQQVGLSHLLQDQPIAEAEANVWATVQNRYHVMLTQAGAMTVWDLVEGKQISQQKFELKNTVETIAAMQHQDRVITMVCYRSPDGFNRRVSADKVFGPLISISLKDGQVQWKTEIEEMFDCRADQPTGWPLLILWREINNPTDNSRTSAELMALDVRYGTIVDRREGTVPRTIISPVINLDSSRHQAFVRLGRFGVQYDFSNTPPAKDEEGAEKKPDSDTDPFGLFDPFR